MALDFFAGSCGGASGIATGYPLDTVKVLMQTQTISSTGERKYRSTFQTIGRVTREEGFRRLYRGLPTPLATVALTNSVTFGVYGLASRQWGNDGAVEAGRNGFCAGLVRSFVISPIEVVKIQQQVRPQLSVREVAAKVWNTAGLKGFAKGYPATLTREPVAFFCYFSSFELMTKGKKDKHWLVFLAGGFAGIFSWITTYPQDVIKSRVQGDGFGEAAKYRGSWHCLKTAFAREGLPWLYRGFGSTVYRAFVVNAVVLGVYNLVMKICSD